VLDYENIFTKGNNAKMIKVKMKVIQGMIQIDRPVNWTKDKITNISNEIRNTELYNANKLNKRTNL
jgi:hypothetical protein